MSVITQFLAGHWMRKVTPFPELGVLKQRGKIVNLPLDL